MPREMSREELLRVDRLGISDAAGGAAWRQRVLGPAGSGQVAVVVPQISHLPPYHTTTIRCHRKLASQVTRFFELIDALDLENRLVTYDGCYCYRAKRGAASLSAHAWGAAIDLNQATNGLGREPAPIGRSGCVRELVGVAESCGFAWGGFWSRPDGMHFQARALLAAEDLPVLRDEVERRWRTPVGELAYRLIDGEAWVKARDIASAIGIAVQVEGGAWVSPAGLVPCRLVDGHNLARVRAVSDTLGWELSTAMWPTLASEERRAA